jgi:hypothetical protein
LKSIINITFKNNIMMRILVIELLNTILTLQCHGLCTTRQRCLPHVAEVRAMHGSVAPGFSSYFELLFFT